jgi:hypothetical protein
MRAKSPRSAAALLAALVFLLLGSPAWAASGLKPYVELEAFPLFGLDRIVRGGGGSCALGLEWAPFALGLRSGAVYDLSLDSCLLRFDCELGFGEELRAIVGCCLPLGSPSLGPDRLSLESAPWPNRFGLGATIFELPRPILGAVARVDGSLVYTAYRFAAGAAASSAAALSGTAAFAVGLEAQILVRLRWTFSGRSKAGLTTGQKDGSE